MAAELDRDVAERVIRVVLEHAPVDDLSRNAITGAQMLLLIGLIAAAQFDGQELDHLLTPISAQEVRGNFRRTRSG